MANKIEIRNKKASHDYEFIERRDQFFDRRDYFESLFRNVVKEGIKAGEFRQLDHAIFAKAIAAAGTAETTVAPIQFGWIGIIIFPIFYGVLGFLTGAVGAWVYNLLAKWIGGVELELTK